MHRKPWNGFVEYDADRNVVQPEACREGHPLADVAHYWDGTFYTWRCLACVDAGAADPLFRMRRPVGSLTRSPSD